MWKSMLCRWLLLNITGIIYSSLVHEIES
ncbi:hypothetical protein LINPERHAP1_LOCUS40624 [Linum perenne]